jgi:pimeloyl-ACP methyl ester carboxylesterase
VADAVARAREASGGRRVTLVGHSAGGWLARAFLGDARYGAAPGLPNPAVAALVSLGTPHLPPPAGVFDVTRGALSWLHGRLPGAHFADRGVRCVASARACADASMRAWRAARRQPQPPSELRKGALIGLLINS